MLFADHPVVVRGGGDLASGVVSRLHAAGFPVVVLELARPLAIRRAVAFASAVASGETVVDGTPAVLAGSPEAAQTLADEGAVALLVAPTLPDFPTPPWSVVDGRMAKRNLGTTIDQAPLVVGLGPGFTAGADCHAVVETMRGHRLGRVIWEGTAAADTGVPGELGGVTADRVVRAPNDGTVEWLVAIGDAVEEGDHIGAVGDTRLSAPIGGVVRGLLGPGYEATAGLKIADIDPRADRSACFEISDKARLVGAGVLEAMLTRLNQS